MKLGLARVDLNKTECELLMQALLREANSLLSVAVIDRSAAVENVKAAQALLKRWVDIGSA